MNRFFKKLSQYFIPRDDNEYKPHFFHTKVLGIFTLIIVFIFVITFALNTIALRSGVSLISAVLPSVLVDLTNADRANYGLHALKTNPVLEEVAQRKANDMAAKGYFSHVSPDGTTPWYWFDEVGYEYDYAGENLAVYFTDSVELARAWMNSPTHRANILGEYFSEIGIATARGVYDGYDTVFVVQVFGQPESTTTPSQEEDFEADEIAISEESDGSVLGVATPIVALGDTNDNSVELDDVKDVSSQSNEVEFIAVKNEGGEPVPVVLMTDEVATSSYTATETHSVYGEAPVLAVLATSPTTLLKVVYSVLALFITIALILMIVVEIKRQHPWHILLASALLVLILVLLYVSQTYVFGGVVIK